MKHKGDVSAVPSDGDSSSTIAALLQQQKNRELPEWLYELHPGAVGVTSTPPAPRLVSIELNPGPAASSSSSSSMITHRVSRLSFVNTFLMVSSLFLNYFSDEELLARIMPLSVRLSQYIAANLNGKQTRRYKQIYDEIQQQLATIIAARSTNSPAIQSDLDTSLRDMRRTLRYWSKGDPPLAPEFKRLVLLGAQLPHEEEEAWTNHISIHISIHIRDWLTWSNDDSRAFTAFGSVRSLILAPHVQQTYYQQHHLFQHMLHKLMNLSKLHIPRSEIDIGQISMTILKQWYELMEWLLTLIEIHIERKDPQFESAAYDIYKELMSYARGICAPQVRCYAHNQDPLVWNRLRLRPWCDSHEEAAQLVRMQSRIWKRCLTGVFASIPVREHQHQLQLQLQLDLDQTQERRKQSTDDVVYWDAENTQQHHHHPKSSSLTQQPPHPRDLLLTTHHIPLNRSDLCYILFTCSRQYQHDFHTSLNLLRKMEDSKMEHNCMKEWINRFFSSRASRRTLGMLIQSGALLKLLYSSALPSHSFISSASVSSPSSSSSSSSQSSWSDLLLLHHHHHHDNTSASRLICLLYFQLIRSKEVKLLHIFHSFVPPALTITMRHDSHYQLSSPLHFLLQRVYGCRHRIFDLLFREAMKQYDGNIEVVVELKNDHGVTLAALLQQSKNRDLLDRLDELHPNALPLPPPRTTIQLSRTRTRK